MGYEFSVDQALRRAASCVAERPAHMEVCLQAYCSRVLRSASRYHECTFENYQCLTDPASQRAFVECAKDYASNLEERWKNREGLIFFGTRGTGKDHVMFCVAMEAFRQKFWVARIDGQEIFSRLRDNMRDDAQRESEFIAELVEPDFLWISDPVLSGHALTRYQQQILYLVVEQRYRDGKPIWLTVNTKNRGELSEMIGGPITDRLRHGAVVFHTEWESWRKSK